jgi:hypothetical protein
VATAIPDGKSGRRDRPRRQGGRRRQVRSSSRCATLPAVRLAAEELAAVRVEAWACGITVSDLVRRRLLGRRLPRAVPAINRDAWSRLGPLAANLNQYVRAIHQGQAAGAPLPLLEALRCELRALRRSLVDDPEDQ